MSVENDFLELEDRVGLNTSRNRAWDRIKRLARLGAKVEEEAACAMDLMHDRVHKDNLAAFGLAVLAGIKKK